jgi:lysophospholipase L1-like esterase
MQRLTLPAALLCAVCLAGCGGKSGGGVITDPTPVARISRTKFLAFGDSITAGEVTQPVGAAGGIGKLVLVPSASYPSVLQSKLASTYTSQASSISVSNAGLSNETILEGAQRFESAFPQSQAQVVLLQEGINFLNLIGPDTSTGVMRIMVQKAKDGGAKVFVGSMIPTVPGRPRATVTPAALVTYNSVLQIMCTQENVTYVDLYNPMLSEAEQLIGSDGLHPTEAGYRRMADLFFTAIRASLQEP